MQVMIRMLTPMKMIQMAQELVHQFRTLLALALMARRSQAMEYFTGPEKEGWLAAAQKELNSFKQKNVFEEVDPSELPKGRTVIPMKWVLTKKFDANGELKSYKARMVCQGFRQKRVWIMIQTTFRLQLQD